MSSSVFSSNSFSVSDDESDDPTGKLKVQGRRKRKKPFLRSNRGFLKRSFMLLTRWWPPLVFVSAIILRAFEALKLGRKQSEMVKVDKGQLEGSQALTTNLNRLDPTARVVNGVRDVSLKLLKQEELNKLEFYENTVFSSPVKRVIYKIDFGQHHVEGNITMLRQQNGMARFNLFTGSNT